MFNMVQNCSYFSLCLDESTDQADVSQLLIFICMTQDDFSTKEELLDICSLRGTTKGKDIYDAVKMSVDNIGGFDKCSCIVTDGAKAMIGEKSGCIGLFRESGVHCPVYHCIIHQMALCGKSVKVNEVFKTVIKIINKIRGGNRALLHRQLRQFLEDMDAEYDDLLLYNHVRWLSAGKCLQRFFAIRNEIHAFLNTFASSDSTDLEQFQSMNFLKQLAFLTDITGHLNELNLKLQGTNQLVSDLMGNINGFRNKLKIFKITLERNDLTHFSSCRRLAEDVKDEETLEFSAFNANIQEIMDEFSSRFKDFEKLKINIQLFSNPLGVDIEEQDSSLQLELCDVQGDVFLQTKQEKGPEFFKLLSSERFPNLSSFGRKMTSMFGSTYTCESVFSTMKFIKNRYRSRLTDCSLLHLLRLATTEIEVNIPALVNAADRPQFSH